jgi:2-polyprenyl-6-methoxyphenol hydroxylase-like FAD-dependent oxidoreductase
VAGAQVLICGAGPTGLVLALQLARRGVPFRVIDRAAGPGRASRAMIVHARTLEFYRQLGIADDVVAGGVPMERFHVRKRGRDIVTLPLTGMGEGVTPYPFFLCYPQDDHERLLVGKLKDAGIEVEWNVELTAFTQDADRVRVTLDRGGTPEETEVAYLCGCDGAHSAVRHGLGLSFLGGTYDDLYYVADVRTERPATPDGYVNLAGSGFTLLLPVRSTGMQRLIGIVPRELAGRDRLTFDDLRGFAERLVGVRVTEVNWFSTYRVHHRVTSAFRGGRCFLAGDAAHVHSPVGGQGMNTGIGDAVNLGWKLAGVLQGRLDPAALDSFEAERLPFARALVATTDRAFALIGGRGLVGRLFRAAVLPLLLPVVAGTAAARRLMFRLLSQVRIRYRSSPLSSGRAGGVRGGDRLPWVPDADNFAPLTSLDWQVHVYSTAAPSLRDAAAALGLPLHEFPWSPGAAAAGLLRDATYLVRPDGYVAHAEPSQEPQRLAAAVARLGLKRGTAG